MPQAASVARISGEAKYSSKNARGEDARSRAVSTSQPVPFERHAFHPVRPLELFGHAHWLMEADLSAYPASLSPVTSKAA